MRYKKYFLMFIFSFFLNTNFVNAQKSINDGTYIIHSLLNQNKVVDVKNGNINNGNNIQLYSINNSNAQKWNIKYSNGYYKISSLLNSNKCLDVKESSFKNFTNIQLYDCNDSDSQKFTIKDIGNGNFSIIAKNTKFYMDVSEAKTSNGTNIQIYQNNGNNAQKWKLVEVLYTQKSINDGTYIINTTLDTNKAVDVAGAKTNNGTNIQLYQNNGNNAQKWNIKYSGGYYTFVSKLNSNKCLTVKNSNFSINSNIYLYNCNNSDSQKFIIKPLSNGYFSIVTKVNSLYVDIAGAKTTNCTNVQLFYNNDNNAQKFKFTEVVGASKSINDGTYVINTALDLNKALDVDGANTSNGSNVQIYENGGNNDAQKWDIKYYGGYYTFISRLNNNKCLTVEDSNFSIYSNIYLYDCNNSDSQKFIIKDVGDGYFSIITKTNSLYVDIDGANTSNSTNIQLFYNNGNNAQKFKFVESLDSNQIIDNGTYIINTALDTNKAIDVAGAKTNNGTNIQIYQNNGNNAQKWDVEYLDGYYRFVSRLNNTKCLTVKNSNFSVNSNIYLYDCNNSDSQKFIIKPLSNGYFSIVTKVNSLYVDIAGAKTTNCTNVQLFYNNDNNAQKFKFNLIENKIINDGLYSISTKINNNEFVDVTGGIGKNNINVQIYENNNNNAQKWFFKRLENNAYTIRSGLNSNLYLSVNTSSKNKNVYLSSNKTEWELEYIGSEYFYIIEKNSGLYLNIENGKALNESNLNALTQKRNEAQMFRIDSTSINLNSYTLPDGIYNIKSNLDSNKLLDVSGARKVDGTNIQIYQNNGDNAQKWYLKYINNGYYQIRSALNINTVVEIKDSSNAYGTNIQLHKINIDNGNAQKWRLVDDGNGHITFKSALGNLCIDVNNSKTSNETNVQSYLCYYNNAQKWNLTIDYSKKIYNGIDVSSWQGNIEWGKVSSANIGFAVIRAGRGDNWESQDDINFINNVIGCETYNIPYAVYLYSYAKNVNGSTALGANSEAATSEAEHVLRLLKKIKDKGYSPTLKTPVYFDMEDKSVEKLGEDRLTDIANKFCSIIQSNGYKCGIYSYTNWLNSNLKITNLANNYNIWVAEWSGGNSYNTARSTKPSYNTTPYKMWQFSDSGKISGISGNVDLDLGYDIFD